MRAGAITINSGVDINGKPYLSFKTDDDAYQRLVVRGGDIDALRDVLRRMESEAIKQAHTHVTSSNDVTDSSLDRPMSRPCGDECVPHWDSSAAAEYDGPQFGPEAYVRIGRTLSQYAAMLAEARKYGEGVKVSNDPGWHCHPALGITGHLHSNSDHPHTHYPVVGWDTTNPVPLPPHTAEVQA